MNIEKTKDENDLAVVLDGRLDTDSAPDFETAMMEELPGLGTMSLDLGKLDYISSAGLRVLLKLHRKSGGRVRIVKMSAPVQDILDITGLSEILYIEE